MKITEEVLINELVKREMDIYWENHSEDKVFNPASGIHNRQEVKDDLYNSIKNLILTMGVEEN